MASEHCRKSVACARVNFFLAGVIVPAVLLVCACAGKRSRETQNLVSVGSDSVSLHCMQSMFEHLNVSSSDTAHALLQCILATVGGKDAGEANDTVLMKKLAEQLSMRTGRKWTRDGAASVIRISSAVSAYIERAGDSADALTRLRAYISDSLLYNNLALKDKVIALADSLLHVKTAAGAGRDTKVCAVIEKVLGIPGDAALVVLEFQGPRYCKSTIDYAEAAKGLIYEPSKKNLKQQNKTKSVSPKLKSVLALRYRNEKSIHDSIQKHEPNLRELYKKLLKVNPNMAGIVMVRFRIDPSGKVAEIEISRSELGSDEFEKELTGYLYRVHFQPIPDEVGDMVFEYPFNFAPDI
jgi:TonB family protein